MATAAFARQPSDCRSPARSRTREELYSGFVAPGSYLIVEGTNVTGHPVHPTHGPGPTEALEIFLPKDHRFEADRRREQKILLTLHPGGYLRRPQT